MALIEMNEKVNPVILTYCFHCYISTPGRSEKMRAKSRYIQVTFRHQLNEIRSIHPALI